MAAAAGAFVNGQRSSSTRQARDVTAQLMALPFGVWVVGLVGLAVVGVGVYHVVKGLRRRFTKDLVEHPNSAVVAAAVIGYVAKGVALIATGGLFIQAAFTHDPSGSTGLDGALSALLKAPAGSALVIGIGVGFAAYGLYSFARARYARL